MVIVLIASYILEPVTLGMSADCFFCGNITMLTSLISMHNTNALVLCLQEKYQELISRFGSSSISKSWLLKVEDGVHAITLRFLHPSQRQLQSGGTPPQERS